MPALYQGTAPYAFGWLPPAEGQEVYWECCGNPEGKPVLVLRGGPGSGAEEMHRSLAAATAYFAKPV